MEFGSDRYERMQYRRCGRTGLMLPVISLGMWHNFGGKADHQTCIAMMRTAFDLGITHFDLANNYGPPIGAAEERAGKILRSEFAAHRDELIVSTKAGYRMWDGPYGEWGSKKYLVASLEQSLKRLGLDYVDIFYHHRPDPGTPLEETLGTLDFIVQQGKALYAGISNYRGADYVRAVKTMKQHDWAPITIHQPVYNMTNRWIEKDLLKHTDGHGTGVIVFSPLAQGLLTSKYLDPATPVPAESRAADPEGFLRQDQVTPQLIEKVRVLAKKAKERGQTMAQYTLAWTLRDPRVTSALIGARNAQQVTDCAKAVQNLQFTSQEQSEVDRLFPR